MNEKAPKRKVLPLFLALARWKQVLWITLIVLSPTLIDWLAVWLFTNHSIEGLFTWSLIFRFVVIFILIVCNGVPAFLVLDLLIAHARLVVKRFPSRIMWFLPLVAVILPISIYSVVGLGTVIRTSDKEPELLIADGTGSYGIPDLAIAFWNVTSCINTVKWGTNSNNLSNIIQDASATQEHAFNLRNLLPSTTYFYSINDGALRNFTTPSNATDILTFAVGSDAHFGRAVSNTTATLKMLQEIADPARGNKMFFFLGDMVEYGFEDSMWAQAINTMSPYTSHIPFRPILGNHDTLLGGYSTFPQYFYPTGMEENSSSSRTYYEIKDNNIYFFCMDLEWGNESNSPAQLAWFKTEIAKVPAGSWIIVMSHAFYYSSGIYTDGAWWTDNQQMIQTFAPLFRQYHVQMVFSGHNHHLEALQVNDTHYFIDGGFGGLPDPSRDANGTGSLWYLSDHYGYIETNIHGQNATVSFVSPEGTVYNSFVVNKTV